MRITDKRLMYELQGRMCLGNCLNSWASVNDIRNSSYRGPIAIRSLVPGRKMVSHINQKDLETATERYVEENLCKKGEFLYSEMAAPSMGIQRLMNAELTRTDEGIYLQFGTANEHMADSMRHPKILTLARSKLFLQYKLDPSDFDDLMVLLDEYEDPVIELSLLDKPVGWADRRMVIWEVRHY